MIKHELPTPEVERADEALGRLVSSEVYLFGHGTATPEGATSILADGLDTIHTDLFSTAAGLPTLAEDPQAFEHDKALIEHWPHRDARYVVILGVERLEGDEVPHRRYLQSIVQPRQTSEDVNNGHSTPYSIDPRFVAGYFDVTRSTFTKNANFDPHYEAAMLQTTVNEEIQRELHPLDPLEILEGLGGVATVPEAGRPPEAKQSNEPMIW